MTEDALTRMPARQTQAPNLRKIIQEAWRALAVLDTGRLEELAFACARLQCDLRLADGKERVEVARNAREASTDMAIFARVLDATRSNLEVMRRLRDLRQGAIEYSPSGISSEKRHGID